jgi:hypothetical protein
MLVEDGHQLLLESVCRCLLIFRVPSKVGRDGLNQVVGKWNIRLDYECADDFGQLLERPAWARGVSHCRDKERDGKFLRVPSWVHTFAKS